MKKAMHTTLVALMVLLSWGCSCSVAMETELKCSACEAVAAELQRRLEAELPRQQLDLRHRLDKDGQRYGKVINWKVSEIRAVNLLEDLCDAMDDYTLVTPKKSDIDSDSSSSTEQQQHPVWVKYKGEGSTHVDKADRPEKPEEQLRVKQLTTFCGLLLEGHEEEVVEALMTDQFSQGVTQVLCQQITTRCKGKDYSNSSSSEAGQDEL